MKFELYFLIQNNKMGNFIIFENILIKNKKYSFAVRLFIEIIYIIMLKYSMIIKYKIHLMFNIFLFGDIFSIKFKIIFY